MKKRSKAFFAMVLVAMLLALCAGCSKQDQAQTPSPTDTKVDDQQEENVSQTTLTYIGHASVKIVAKDGTVLYIDPNYYAGDYSDNADYILVTHSHDDHKPVRDLKLNEGGQQINNSDALHDGVYESYDFGSIQVEAVAAGGNMNHDVRYCVGYIVTVDGVSVYHAGDTSMIDEMNALADREIDYAMYPIDGVYNMDAEEATEVANLVGAKHNIPIHEIEHSGKKKGDTAPKSDKFTPEGRLVLEYGETIVIGE